MFSGLEVLSPKYNNKEIYSYIASGNSNNILMSVGVKEFYLDTGSLNLADKHYGGYINTTTHITKQFANWHGYLLIYPVLAEQFFSF